MVIVKKEGRRVSGQELIEDESIWVNEFADIHLVIRILLSNPILTDWLGMFYM
jgi:hypothetical protein